MSVTGINWDTHRHVRVVGPTRATSLVLGGGVVPGHLHVDEVLSSGAAAHPAGPSPHTGPVLRDVARFRPRHRGDLVGFGDSGTWSALSKGDGTFATPQQVVPDFGRNQGWDVTKHVRLLADVTDDGNADLVGFGDAGAYVALAKGDGTFGAPVFGVDNLGHNQGWGIDRHVRLVADVTGDGKGDLIGFGTDAVFARCPTATAPSNRQSRGSTTSATPRAGGLISIRASPPM